MTTKGVFFILVTPDQDFVKLEVLSIEDLRIFCPLKWHERVPDDGVGMAIADIDFKGPQGLVTFLKTRLQDDFSYYGQFEGMKSVVAVGKLFLKSKNIANVRDEYIQIIPGTMMGIFATMEWISRKPGNITIINPIYPPIHTHAKNCGNNINWVDLKAENNWQLDHEVLKEKIDVETKLLVFNNPNNPTGTVFKPSDLRLIADLSNDYGFPCFVDELYDPLVFTNDYTSFASLETKNGSITLRGFSKSYGLAGWRSGFMYITHPDFEEIKYIIEQLIVSPSPVTSLTMEYALTSPVVKAWQDKFKEQIMINVKRAVALFNQEDIECVLPQGCFFVFPKLGVNDEDFSEFLLKRGVEVVPGSKFGPAGKGYVRVNCATSLERIEKGIEKIISGYKDFK